MSDNTNHVRININPKIIAPRSLFLQDGDDSAKTLLRLVTGHECVPMQGGTGEDDETGCGDLEYYDCEDGLGYRLAYRFEPVDHGWQVCVMTEYRVERAELWDHQFDLSRDTLAAELRRLEGYCDVHGYDRRTLQAIADKFAIRL